MSECKGRLGAGILKQRAPRTKICGGELATVSTPTQLSKWHAVRTGRIQHFDTMQTLPYVQTLHSACCGKSAHVLTCACRTERPLCVQSLGGIPECSTLRRRARACSCVTMPNTQSCLSLPHLANQPCWSRSHLLLCGRYTYAACLNCTISRLPINQRRNIKQVHNLPG